MTTFITKTYQQQVLDSVEAYFNACHELPSPSIAFTATTERLWSRGVAYNPLSGFPPDMPYFCLRVPTGGGKTWLAAKSVALVNTRLLRCEHSVILWLVPSKPIRDQTLRALRDRLHPYHTALREAGPITVMDLDEAKNATRATLDTSTTIIVATRQAFQVEDEESRKVYQSSGALMHHFDNLSPTQRDGLSSEGEGAERTIPCSLANVLCLRRPFVVVDEAHNLRNPSTQRSAAVNALVGGARPKKLVLLTATPVNNSLMDLHTLVTYFVRNDAAFVAIGIPSSMKTKSNTNSAIVLTARCSAAPRPCAIVRWSRAPRRQGRSRPARD